MENAGPLLQALGLLTGLFLILFIAVETAGIAERWEGFIRAGLFLSGVPWLALTAARTFQIPALAWAIPLFYGVVGSVKAARLLRRLWEAFQLKTTGGWRCANCGAANEAAATVCYFCQAWRKTSG